MDFGARLAGESFQLFDDATLGAVAAVEKGGNYRNAH
jgi:hypothetical protein